VQIVPIDSEHLKVSELKEIDAMIVPGGFGSRGVEGKIKAIKYARENKLPFLGICLGLQCAVIEAARNLAQLEGATSEEFSNETPHPVIAFLPDQKNITRKGGTMRLGAYIADMQATSLISRLYRWAEDRAQIDFPSLADIRALKPIKKVSERHRHRYEVNPTYHKQLSEAGITFAGLSPDGSLVEFIELDQSTHPYFVATQAHPEFKSRPYKAHPLFAGLVRAALEKNDTSLVNPKVVPLTVADQVSSIAASG
jgi:CTP synthase